MCVCCCLCVSALLVWQQPAFLLAFNFSCEHFFQVRTRENSHCGCVFKKRGHGHGGLPCDFFLDAQSFSAFTFDFAQRVALACHNFYLWLCKHHLFNVLATFSSKSTFAALMVLGHLTTIYSQVKFYTGILDHHRHTLKKIAHYIT